MGKKARKTRWRTLPINSGEQSDSGESNTHSGPYAISKSYQPKPYYTKYLYSSSSQSTPIKSKFQNDPKSTRSSSTTSDNKITFNEDEYTRITTPRQDVLFKKGYLSKPKTYQTQTSTGNSTISTGNSTGNGTPDHQSADGTEGTDLEYESQFVFPNHFVDQNGFYYINSFEPYTPMLVYNPPYCYPEHPESRSKRYSTSSLTESTSPHNEEATPDLSQSGSETLHNSAEMNSSLNDMQPEYTYNKVPELLAEAPVENEEPRKTKKRRRRRLSKPLPNASSSEEGESEDEPESTKPSSNLKADAKIFVPRYNPEEHVQYIMPTNFIPMPLINELPPNFYPPAIPVNFILPDSKVFTSYVNIIPNDIHSYQHQETIEEASIEEKEETKQPSYTKNIDINKIVSKLEEAAKEQRLNESNVNKSPAKRFINNNDAKISKKKSSVNKKPDVIIRTPNRSNDKTIIIKSPSYKNKREEGFTNNNKTDNCSKANEPRNIPKSQNQWIPVPNRKKRRNRNFECEADFDEILEAEKTVHDDGFEAYDINLLVDVPTTNISNEMNCPSIIQPKSNEENDCRNNKVESEKLNAIELPRESDFKECDLQNETKIINSDYSIKEDVFAVLGNGDVNENVNKVYKDKIKAQKGTKKEIHVKIEYRAKRDVKINPQNQLKNCNNMKVTQNEIDVITSDKVNNDKELDNIIKKQIVDIKSNDNFISEINTSNIEITANKDKIRMEVNSQLENSINDYEESLGILAQTPQTNNHIIDESLLNNNTESNLDLLIQTLTDLETTTNSNIFKKKSPPKRVIITDQLIAINNEEQTSGMKVNKVTTKPITKINIKPLINQDSYEKKRVNKKKKKIPQPLNSKPITDDKYDFLLNDTFLEDERTNVEVSEELDKLIQRSLFKAVEEKVDTSVNIDKFFSNISLDDKTEKISDLSAILKSTTNLFSNKRRASTISLEVSRDKTNEEGLYPVTQAVKEWMNKVREATPEIEILKSPKTILKELGPKNSFISRAGECPGGSASTSTETSRDSVDGSIEEDDLISNDDFDKENGLEIAEEAQVLDDKKKENNSTIPKYGNLPYKAICCTLM